MKESEAIEIMRQYVPGLPAPYGSGDDAAVLEASVGSRVISQDALVEGTHFIRAHPPELLGQKILAVNLSDVAAMGAHPEGFVLSSALPSDTPESWWRLLAEGLGSYAQRTGVVLVGGDVVVTEGPLSFSVAAWGLLEGPALTRSGGNPGDALMVTGNIGVSQRGLTEWLALPHGRGWPVAESAGGLQEVVVSHLAPNPPLEAGRVALANGASAGLDLSDGLVVDLQRLAEASGLSIRVDLDRLPPDPLLGDMSAEDRARGGEDYGLAVLVPEDRVRSLEVFGFHAIGESTEGHDVSFHRSGRPVNIGPSFFEHF